MLQNPDHLSLRGRYRQLVRTARLEALRPQWHMDAFDMPSRVHVFTDGVEVRAALFHEKDGWSALPPMEVRFLREPDKLASLVSGLMRGEGLPKTSGVGLIIHLGDEFATAPIRREVIERIAASSKEAKMMEAIIVDEPGNVVEIQGSDEGAYRLLQLGPTTRVAVKLPLHTATACDRVLELRDKYPVRCALVASPIALLYALPLFGGNNEGDDIPAAHVVVFAYPRVTVIAAIENGNIVDLVNLPHGAKSYPATFPSRIEDMLAQRFPSARKTVAGYSNVHISLIQIGNQDIRSFVVDLDMIGHQYALLIDDSGNGAGISQAEMFQRIRERTGKEIWPEFLMFSEDPRASKSYFGDKSLALLKSAARANFLAADIHQELSQPSTMEIGSIIALKAIRAFAIVILACALVWSGWEVYSAMTSQPWNLSAQQASEETIKVSRLKTAIQSIEDWKSVQLVRSAGWATLEAVARLLPEGSGLTASSVDMQIVPMPAPNSATAKGIGFKRTIVIKGNVDTARAGNLDSINNQTVRDLFSGLATQTKTPAYSPEAGPISVKVERQQQQGTIEFVISIEQVVSHDQPYAIRTAAVPPPELTN